MQDIFEDNDPFFEQSPESKYIDIVSNANSNLVANEVLKRFKRLCALEMMLEKHLGVDDIDTLLNEFVDGNSLKVENRYENLLIDSMGAILSLNE